MAVKTPTMKLPLTSRLTHVFRLNPLTQYMMIHWQLRNEMAKARKTHAFRTEAKILRLKSLGKIIVIIKGKTTM